MTPQTRAEKSAATRLRTKLALNATPDRTSDDCGLTRYTFDLVGQRYCVVARGETGDRLFKAVTAIIERSKDHGTSKA